jgi:transcriptional regulator of acetoin/glycerol metabolism
MTPIGKMLQRPLGIVLPLEEVKRRVVVDAFDKCGGNFILAAHLLGIGKSTVYRLVRVYNYRRPEVQAAALRGRFRREAA